MKSHHRHLLIAVIGILGLFQFAWAQNENKESDGSQKMKEKIKAEKPDKAERKNKRMESGPKPTYENVEYGPYGEFNQLDFWQAKSDKPTPVVVFIHGGGFVGGDKSTGRGGPLQTQCLASGISFASINYRYRTEIPIQDVLRDCSRSVQFLKSKDAQDFPNMIEKIDPANWRAFFMDEAKKLKDNVIE